MRCPQKSQVFSGDTNGITKIHCNNNKNVNVLFPQGSDMKNTKIKSKIEYTIPILHAKIPIFRIYKTSKEK